MPGGSIPCGVVGVDVDIFSVVGFMIPNRETSQTPIPEPCLLLFSPSGSRTSSFFRSPYLVLSRSLRGFPFRLFSVSLSFLHTCAIPRLLDFHFFVRYRVGVFSCALFLPSLSFLFSRAFSIVRVSESPSEYDWGLCRLRRRLRNG